ncbi:HAD-IB family hydrolase [Streptomyces silvisoli]|uniref:1-acyl-sn-glycerol-3-phosphate acyltransferase n=1 Tax=Streptomyces silvisoli TaxID=3034235 RepID=A0ABT5ZS35_9ACTN|nr:HAD-IB family hydrolase [Streptomyces silvisoli]MDF3292637.1 HAD-IB family hydrolase [Streptomyces silvisoli]
MTSVAALLASIADAPPGPSTAAVFDLDGTIVQGYTVKTVYRDQLSHADITPGQFNRLALAALDMRFRQAPLDKLIGVAFEALAGRTEDELSELGERLFRQDIASRIYPQARQLVHAHRKAGHRIVMATSATPFQADPVATDMGFDTVLCTRPKVRAGTLTGDVDGDILWGPGKARAITDYAQQEGIHLSDSFAYSNGTEDVPMLKAVGHPRPLNPEPGLADIAHMRGWPIARLEPPRRGLTLTAALRTGAALTALSTSATLGAAIGLLNRNRQAGANVPTAAGCGLALALGGITLKVTGENNLWSHRPAVFMFNHQSSLDMLVVGDLLRRDCTGIAKKELARDPRFAPIGWVMDIVYVDRAHTQHAKEALQPAVSKLREGISIAIAPEGTRSPTSTLAPFKKGGFHIALQAGVPIVPIVIRNTGELMWRNSVWLHPGTVDVAVLEPVPTSGWNPDDLNDHVAYVRQRFLDTLADWPGEISHAP